MRASQHRRGRGGVGVAGRHERVEEREDGVSGGPGQLRGGVRGDVCDLHLGYCGEGEEAEEE